MEQSNSNFDAVFENLRLELRRGCLVVAVMAALRTEKYGYTLRKLLDSKGLSVEESTLYPLLRRLENQGMLQSEWREDAKRKKRYYRLSDAGRDVLEHLLSEWRGIDVSIDSILAEDIHDDDTIDQIA